METNKAEILSPRIQSLLKQELLDFSSRFNRSFLIHYSDFNILTFETYDRIYNPSLENKNQTVAPSEILFYVVTAGTQFKPWLISQDAYQDPGYWWWIMEFNNLFDVEELTVGKTIQIPPLQTLSALRRPGADI